MADFKFNCPHCQQQLEAPPEMAGQVIDCPTCKKPIEISLPPLTAAMPPSPEPPQPSKSTVPGLVLTVVFLALVCVGLAGGMFYLIGVKNGSRVTGQGTPVAPTQAEPTQHTGPFTSRLKETPTETQPPAPAKLPYSGRYKDPRAKETTPPPVDLDKFIAENQTQPSTTTRTTTAISVTGTPTRVPFDPDKWLAENRARVSTVSPAQAQRFSKILDEMPAAKSSVTPNELFSKVRSALVIITTANGAGSGFVISMDNKKYLITSEHILRGGLPFTATLLNGTKLAFANIAVADDRDLVRLEVLDKKPFDADAWLAKRETPSVRVQTEKETLLPWLAERETPSVPVQTEKETLLPSPTAPNIGDTVTVFGNSEGSGVATSLGGKVLGVGPDLIEVDAPFVQGNSGSPIVNSSGMVMGVASFATRPPDPNEWVKQGTRFTQVRRFGITLSNVKWIPMTMEQYLARSETLQDLETYCIDTYDLLFTAKYYKTSWAWSLRYDFDQNKKKYRRQPKLCQVLASVASSYDQRASDNHQYGNLADAVLKAKNNQRGQLSSDLFMFERKTQDSLKNFTNAYAQIYQTPAPIIQKTDWMTQRFREEAMFWRDVLKSITDQSNNLMTH